ncbi:MAG: HAMP domain-containing histidine kinase [Bacteroidetes bacterium]|nr:HAMP domain-containing histidine kinase [Bacteroidota bacterium]MCL1969164.1 HAMP domain-containing histidine kinase [Bacteroidota bacterium]
MKKRVIFSIAAVLIMITSLLMTAIFQLYKDAESMQRNIFSKEVSDAVTEVMNKIDQVLKGDTIGIISTMKISEDTILPVLFQKHAKKYILDASRVQPVGIINSTITYMSNNFVSTTYDTVYFDTTLYKSIIPYPMPWETDLAAFIANQNTKRGKKGLDIELIEMDSNTVRLLNKEFLYRIIKGALLDQNITANFEFALYNHYTTSFVVLSDEDAEDKLLQSKFVYNLKPSERFLAPHLLMLYFPTERLILFKRYSFITTLIIVFVSLIMLIFIFMLHILYRQKKISDIKNDFINNMTHEFKTPLSTITLACEALSGELMSSNKKNRDAYVSIIADENERLKLMVNNILQLAQLKKGQLKLHIETCNLHELIIKICDSFSLLIKTNHGELREYLYAEYYTLPIDKMHIQNVIINLIENGIKYSKEHPKIAIKTENDKRNLLISVSDNGIGMSKKHLRHIFDEFYRVATGNIHNQKGQGLGLVYVKKIVELHGGSISVVSEPDKGTIFCIALPLKQV